MATYKAEALHQRYRRRLRPRSALRAGPAAPLGPADRPAAPLANRCCGSAPLQRAAKAAAGIDQRRRDSRRFDTRSAAPLGARAHAGPRTRTWWSGPTRSPTASPPTAAGRRSTAAGGGRPAGRRWSPSPPAAALTWITTGQLDAARAHPGAAPSTCCTRTSRAGIPVRRAGAVLPGDPALGRRRAAATTPGPPRSRAGVRSLAELLSRVDGLDAAGPDRRRGRRAAALPPRQRASAGRPTPRLLASTGAQVTRVGGCCGLAGNFGVEQGHYEVSVAVAEHDLLPAVRAAGERAVVLADGFSCRTQLDDLADVQALHLAELLAGALGPARGVLGPPRRGGRCP